MAHVFLNLARGGNVIQDRIFAVLSCVRESPEESRRKRDQPFFFLIQILEHGGKVIRVIRVNLTSDLNNNKFSMCINGIVALG